jgi:hypothetical protein
MLNLDEFIVIDDVVSPQFQKLIEEWLLSPASTWSFARDVALDDNVIDNLKLNSRPGFSKTLFSLKSGKSNDLYPMILPLVFEASAKAGLHVGTVLFSRSFITLPIPGDTGNTFDHVHVDTPDEHIVCLYYANDSDGDTVFFDWTVPQLLEDPEIQQALEASGHNYNDQTLLDLLDKRIAKSDFKVIKRVTPKKGRAVFFNGLRYHSSTRCTAGYRLIVNTCFRP